MRGSLHEEVLARGLRDKKKQKDPTTPKRGRTKGRKTHRVQERTYAQSGDYHIGHGNHRRWIKYGPDRAASRRARPGKGKNSGGRETRVKKLWNFPSSNRMLHERESGRLAKTGDEYRKRGAGETCQCVPCETNKNEQLGFIKNRVSVGAGQGNKE